MIYFQGYSVRHRHICGFGCVSITAVAGGVKHRAMKDVNSDGRYVDKKACFSQIKFFYKEHKHMIEAGK